MTNQPLSFHIAHCFTEKAMTRLEVASDADGREESWFGSIFMAWPSPMQCFLYFLINAHEL